MKLYSIICASVIDVSKQDCVKFECPSKKPHIDLIISWPFSKVLRFPSIVLYGLGYCRIRSSLAGNRIMLPIRCYVFYSFACYPISVCLRCLRHGTLY